jgi:hypothetical protein
VDAEACEGQEFVGSRVLWGRFSALCLYAEMENMTKDETTFGALQCLSLEPEICRRVRVQIHYCIVESHISFKCLTMLTFIPSHKNDTSKPRQTLRLPSSARNVKYTERRQKKISVRRRKYEMVLETSLEIYPRHCALVNHRHHVRSLW